MTTQPETPMVERVSKIEGIAEQINLRLAENHDDIQALSGKIDTETKALSTKIDTETKALSTKIDTETKALSTKIDTETKALSAKIDTQGEKIDAVAQALREEIRQSETNLRSEMNARFNTMYVLIGTFWATTLGGIIAILVRG